MRKLIELIMRLLGRETKSPSSKSSPPSDKHSPRSAPPPIAPAPPAPTVAEEGFPPHFPLAELIASDAATRFGIDNSPPQHIRIKLRQTARLMERVRTLLGDKPIIVTSGYRSPALNAAVRGSARSAHCLGWAIDFKCPAYGTPLEICRAIADSEVMGDVDQLIHEFGGWVHISFDPRRRGEKLTMFKANGITSTVAGLHPIKPGMAR